MRVAPTLLWLPAGEWRRVLAWLDGPIHRRDLREVPRAVPRRAPRLPRAPPAVRTALDDLRAEGDHLRRVRRWGPRHGPQRSERLGEARPGIPFRWGPTWPQAPQAPQVFGPAGVARPVASLRWGHRRLDGGTDVAPKPPRFGPAGRSPSGRFS